MFLYIPLILSILCGILNPYGGPLGVIATTFGMLLLFFMEKSIKKYFPIFALPTLLAFVTFVSLIRNDKISNSKTKMPLGYVLFASGYMLLNHTMNYVLLALGTISIVLGTLIYLKELHKQYLWY